MKSLLLIAFLAGCSASQIGSGTYAAKCEVACRLPTSGACATADETGCRHDCEVKTEGLATLCAQCLIDNSGWQAYGRSSNCDASVNPTCPAPTTPTCNGFVMPSTTSTECSASCLMQMM